MNSSLKGVAIVAAAMLTVGIVLTGVGFMAGGNHPIHFDKKGFHVGENETSGKLEDFSQDLGSFNSISVNLDYYDVDLVPGDKFAVEGKCFSQEGKPDISVENGTLTVKDTKHNGVSINLDLPGLITYNNQPVLKIYYPKDTAFKDIKIKCDTSDLAYEGLNADQIDFELDFGKLNLSNAKANNITVGMDSGDCTLKNISAAEKLDISNDMGKITLEGANSKKLKINANSGDVSLTDVTAENSEMTVDMGKLSGTGMKTNGLKATADSGDINLQGSLLGLTDITCDMGSVKVSPGGSKDQFNYELSTDMGSVSIGDEQASGTLKASNESAKNTLNIKADSGSINVNFN